MDAGGAGRAQEERAAMIPCRLFRTSSQRMPIALTNAQIRFLRGQAHDLKAILQVGGKGVSDALVAELDGALEHHELIKVKVAAEDRDARDAMIDGLAARTDAALVQRIGHTAVLYRPSKDKRHIVLPRG
jgi:RNA-binding protein